MVDWKLARDYIIEGKEAVSVECAVLPMSELTDLLRRSSATLRSLSFETASDHLSAETQSVRAHEEIQKQMSFDMQDMLKALEAHESLTTVHCVGVELRDERLLQLIASGLAHAPRLRLVEFTGNGLGDKGASAVASGLAQGAAVECVHLYGNRIRVSGAKALAESLRSNKSLKDLSLRYNEIGDQGVALLAEALTQNDTLVELGLAGNGISCLGMTKLSQALQRNKAVSALFLRDNMISTDGILALEPCLRATTSNLVTLDLASNALGPRAGEILDRALGVNKTLRYLDLAYNSLGQEGIVALAQGLASNQTLRSIDLSKNGADPDGAAGLAAALILDTGRLESLNFSSNSIGSFGAIALSIMLQKNTHLKSLALNDNEIGWEAIRVLARNLRHRPMTERLELLNNRIEHAGYVSLKNLLCWNPKLVDLRVVVPPSLKSGFEASVGALRYGKARQTSINLLAAMCSGMLPGRRSGLQALNGFAGHDGDDFIKKRILALLCELELAALNAQAAFVGEEEEPEDEADTEE